MAASSPCVELIFLCMLCFSFTIGVSYLLSDTPVTDDQVIKAIFCTVVMGGISAMLFLLMHPTYLEDPSADETNNAVHSVSLVNYAPYVGLVIFAIGTFLYDMIAAAATIQCIIILTQSDSQNTTENTNQQTSSPGHLNPDIALAITFCICKLSVTIIELVFLMRFRGMTSVKVSSRILVLLIITSNICIWLLVFITETTEKLNLPNVKTDLSNSSSVQRCQSGTTDMDNFLHQAQPICFPCEMEFCLTAAAMLFCIIGRKKDNSMEYEPPERVQEIQCTENSETSHRLPGILRKRPMRHYMVCAAALVISLTMISTEILSRLDPCARLPRDITQLVFYILLLLASSVACIVMRNHDKKKLTIDSEKGLLILATTGELIYLFAVLMAEIKYHPVLSSTGNSSSEDSLVAPVISCPETSILDSYINMFLNGIDVIAILVQTNMLVSWKSFDRNSSKRLLLTQATGYLCICNFFIWIVGSFIKGHLRMVNPAALYIYGPSTWTAITQAFYPLILFYRFHSFHMLLQILADIA